MTPETLEALQLSIKHWHRLATGTSGYGEFIFCEDCALCSLFNSSVVHKPCKGCPVAERANAPHCKNTPWYDVYRVIDSGKFKLTKAFQDAAAKELAFLKTLLPERFNTPLPVQNQLSLILL